VFPFPVVIEACFCPAGVWYPGWPDWATFRLLDDC
jgi:hypothetical protein